MWCDDDDRPRMRQRRHRSLGGSNTRGGLHECKGRELSYKSSSNEDCYRRRALKFVDVLYRRMTIHCSTPSYDLKSRVTSQIPRLTYSQISLPPPFSPPSSLLPPVLSSFRHHQKYASATRATKFIPNKQIGFDPAIPNTT